MEAQIIYRDSESDSMVVKRSVDFNLSLKINLKTQKCLC